LRPAPNGRKPTADQLDNAETLETAASFSV
jgi:hypothetical protein